MPRPKSHTKSATMKASKRWFPDAKTSSKVSQNTNLRCAKLEEECKSFFRLDEKYTGQNLTPAKNLRARFTITCFVKGKVRGVNPRPNVQILMRQRVATLAFLGQGAPYCKPAVF
ncbi:hypothetical protein TNCT_484991 [Trichonephila clavata]|uniref:Uncharacterized protein n=1 Tax=Trichonephila clavata TaxID=2740835 RepID=A0A8X6LLI6_TRICU|nr:hypothetical protein TNCT_484991 [Trichonephila clavata]